MIFKKDNFWLGLILGMLAPVLGLILFKVYKFGVFTFKETFQFMFLEPGFKTLSVGLSLSLLLNAALFTFYINAAKDKTAKGIFVTTLVYGSFILLVKTFY
ncbi:MAG TPA: hypothetical protein DHV17_05255 [Chitinophagaceae bacterium]|nr:hypothetical protein [Chitinophagaceae bacterium]HRF26348.1 hypothetical protein [Ferruginibacter sp.]